MVGVDGSEHSRTALRWAAATAQASGARLRAVQAWSHPASAVVPFGPEPVTAAERTERIRQEIDAIVSEVLGPAVAVTADPRAGPAAGAILEAVTPDSVLVLGTRGRGGFAGLLLGSVSQQCIEYAPCPVVVTRTERVPGPGEEILVGQDRSDDARQALDWADRLATATGAEVRAVYAWHPRMAERPPEVGDRLRAEAARTAEHGTELVDRKIRTDEIEGDPRDVLVNETRRNDPVLTVVGRRGASDVRAMYLGSTANHLVRHSDGNVAVVPPRMT